LVPFIYLLFYLPVAVLPALHLNVMQKQNLATQMNTATPHPMQF